MCVCVCKPIYTDKHSIKTFLRTNPFHMSRM